MNGSIDESVLLTFQQFIVDETGILFDENHRNDLIRHIVQTCADLEISIDTCISLLQDQSSTKKILEGFIKNITIGETYFFRDKNLFIYLRDTLLPDLIRERRKCNKLFLRIWSAACSSGEEPYSLAILLRYLIPDIADWDIFLLATDINQEMLKKAHEGIYSRWSFRDDPLISIGQYFSPKPDNRLKIDNIITDMVRFERMNLIKDPFFYNTLGSSSMDVILCRNVLMYFSPSQAGEVVSHLADSLRNDGVLIVSPQEIGIITHNNLHLFHFESVFLHIKGQIKPQESLDVHLCLQDPDTSVLKPDLISDIYEEKHNEIILDSSEYLLKPDNSVYQDVSNNGEDCQFEILLSENKLDDAGNILLKRHREAENRHLLQQIEVLIRAYAGTGEYEKALGWTDRMIDVEILNPKPYMLKAAILDEKGFRDSSIQSLRQSLYADPDYLPAHLAIAGIYMKSGKIDLAKHHYSLSIQLLDTLPPEQILEETDGIPAERMKEMIQMLLR